MPVELRYDRFGSPDAKGGPKLVVLHGLFGSRRNWRGAAKALAASGEKRGQGLTLFTVDLRHHGESPNRGPFSLEALARDVCACIEGPAIGGGSVILLGHSLGGKVALQVLQQCPEVVRFLLHNLRRGEDRRLYLQLVIEAITAGFYQACRPALPQTGLGNEPEGGQDSEYTKGAALEGAWRGTPLLSIRGEKSEYMPSEHFEALTNWFRMHTPITIKNAGHWLHVERQEEFVNAVMEGLEVR